MKRAISPLSSFWSRFVLWLPVRIDRRTRLLAWLSFAFQAVLIATGGAVRLTGSGLGCPTWPRCTADSFVATPEMGIHGVIEFGNRMLTFVLAMIVIAVFLSVVRLRAHRPDLFRLTLLQGLSIPLQAVIGGITVLTGLNPYIVGAHFIVSILLMALTATLVYRVHYGPRGTERAVGPLFFMLAHLTSLFVGVTVVVGILATGSGPHAGDAATPRNGLDPGFLQHLHSWPAYATLAATLLLVVAAFVRTDAQHGSNGRIRRFVLGLLAVEAAQICVGIGQARLGLPEVLVGLHMVLAGLLVAAMTAVLLALRRPHNAVESLDVREFSASAPHAAATDR